MLFEGANKNRRATESSLIWKFWLLKLHHHEVISSDECRAARFQTNCTNLVLTLLDNLGL